MTKRELEQQLMVWSNQRVNEGPYRNSSLELRRLYQTGVLLGLLTSVAENDFYAKKLIERTICKKD